ncbi:MAG: hypothetical protein KKB70_04690 [Proteobacteria bacterium]|nr:hypothetical protein [Pseudomonadota bacterium]MBU1611574.1 hypothetical protein [Pseudomonadota bacterium]
MIKTKLFLMMMLAGALLLVASPVMAENTMSKMAELDGTHWLQSTSAEKRAFLYGAGNAIVLEYHGRTKHGEQPSKLVQGWVDVFKNQSWSQMEHDIDQYYIKNPTKMGEHVMKAMWTTMIKPNMKD